MTIFAYRFAFHPLSCQGTGSNSRATAKGFKLGIHNLPSLIHFNLGERKTLHLRINNHCVKGGMKWVSFPSSVFGTEPQTVSVMNSKKKKNLIICLILWDKEFSKKKISNEKIKYCYKNWIKHNRIIWSITNLFSVYIDNWLFVEYVSFIV